ncbi:hypothetical protein LSCM1_02910 [Leishmania martiniquensis]|uniref:Glucoamylase-like protein n=1 Tax=Leishmania martiniquensis TaxID=1580590 RepID=A0A836HJH0_9TRYP|nr:hypothetical protein LSCM1_02910 [Leishmania martiniquensis]
MRRSSPHPPSSTEAAPSLRSYARLSGDAAGEDASNGRGPLGRWADALLNNTSHDVAPATQMPEMASQHARSPLSHVRSQAATKITGRASAQLRQQQNAPDTAFPHHLHSSNRGKASGTSAASPRAIAVAVHPQFSRVSQRALGAAAPAPPSVSAATASVASHASANSTASTTATQASDQPLDEGLPAPLPPPVMDVHTASTGGSVAFAMLRSVSDTPQPTPNTAVRRATRAGAPTHIIPQQLQAPLRSGRVEGNSSCSCRAGSVSGSPLASVETPHNLPGTYASSPFFQRALDGAPTSESSLGAPRAAAAAVSAVAEDDQESSMLQLQDVTPITNAGDSQQESQLLSHPRTTAQSLGGIGQYSYSDGTADHDAGAMPSVLSPMVTNAPSRALPLVGDYSAAAAGNALPWGTLPHTHPPPCPASRVLSGQQVMLSPCVCNISQGALAKLPSQSASLSDMAQLSGTPGGLSTSQSVTMCSTGPQRNRGLVSVAADKCRSMSSAGHSTSPESSCTHVSGICTSLPPLPSQTHISLRDQSSSSLLTSGGNGRSCRTTTTAGSSPCTSAHMSHPQCRVGGVGGYGTHSGRLPSSSSNPTVTPLSIWTSGRVAASAATTAAMTAGQGRTSALPTASTAPGAAGGGSSFSTLTSGPPGLALEKQLLYARKGDLAQILVELASCNPEASRFIHSKALFFAFRRGYGGEAVDAREARPAASLVTRSATAGADKNAWQQARHRGSGASGIPKAVGVPNGDRPRQESCVLKHAAADSIMLSGAAAVHDHNIARCIFPVEVADDEDCDCADSPAGARRSHPAGVKGAATATVPEDLHCPEGRAFSTELHPCLRWYGACRNATSCAYASVPRNVCLNWIRGSCMARTECSGVHRLPSPCPPEVRRIYELNHGLVRRETPVTASAPRVSVGHALPIPPPFPVSSGEARGPFVGGSAATASPASSNADAAATERAGYCAGAGEALAVCPAVTEEPDEASAAVRTPTNQSICKDTFPGGGSTPHRHSYGRDAEICVSTMAMERGGGADTVAVGVVSSSDSSHMDPAMKAEEPVDHEMLQYTGGILSTDAGAGTAAVIIPPCLCSVSVPMGGLGSGMASSTGSSRCSTAEGGSSCANSVSRYLGPEFDRAATAVPERDDGRPGSAVMGLSAQPLPTNVKSIRSICGCVRDGKETLEVIPARPEGDLAGALADVDDECDLSAPAAGTRTRMQSPRYP